MTYSFVNNIWAPKSTIMIHTTKIQLIHFNFFTRFDAYDSSSSTVIIYCQLYVLSLLNVNLGLNSFGLLCLFKTAILLHYHIYKMCVRLSLNISVLECEPFYFLISKDIFFFCIYCERKGSAKVGPSIHQSTERARS
jgi:hypothetical protein